MTSTAEATRRALELPRLVQITVEPDGAVMSCHYCRALAQIVTGDVAGQILRFQDQHFGCDPALTASRADATVPRQQ